MEIPLTTSDHLERAALVYGDRVGIVDEPDQPAPALADLTYREVFDRSRALAAGLERLGVAQGGRVAIVSQNAARLLTLLYGATAWGRIAVPVNFRLNRDEIQYIVESLRRRGPLIDPELDDDLADVDRHPVVRHRGRHRRRALRLRRRAGPVGAATRAPPPPSTTPAAPRPDPRAWR